MGRPWRSLFALEHAGWKYAFGNGSNCCDCLTPNWVVAFRWILFSVWFSIWTWSFTSHTAIDFSEPVVTGSTGDRVIDFFSMLPNWINTWQLVYLFFAASVSTLAVCSNMREADLDITPIFVRLCWMMQTVTVTLSFVTFVTYWTVEWRLLWQDSSKHPPVMHALNPFEHGINFAVALCDYLVMGLPMYYVQLWPSMILYLGYILFSLINDLYRPSDYSVAPYLDWSKQPEEAALYNFGIAFLVVPIVFSFFTKLKTSSCWGAAAQYRIRESTPLKQGPPPGYSYSPSYGAGYAPPPPPGGVKAPLPPGQAAAPAPALAQP